MLHSEVNNLTYYLGGCYWVIVLGSFSDITIYAIHCIMRLRRIRTRCYKDRGHYHAFKHSCEGFSETMVSVVT